MSYKTAASRFFLLFTATAFAFNSFSADIAPQKMTEKTQQAVALNDARVLYGQSTCVANQGEIDSLQNDYSSESLELVDLSHYVKKPNAQVRSSQEILGDGYFGWSPMSYNLDRAVTLKLTETNETIAETESSFVEVTLAALCKNRKTRDREVILSGTTASAAFRLGDAVYVFVSHIDYSIFGGAPGAYVLKLLRNKFNDSSLLDPKEAPVTEYQVSLLKFNNPSSESDRNELLVEIDNFVVTPLQNEE